MGDYGKQIEAIADQLVRLKFEDYKERRREQGLPVEYEVFDEQPETLKRSSYEQIAHMLAKVDALGYEVVPINECAPTQRARGFSAEETEKLAEMEHERWVAERIADGWTSVERNHEAKTTPYLVPYGELDDSVKQYDRDVVNRVIEFLDLAGLAVVRGR